MLILLLIFFNFTYFFAMEKLHLDTIALIVAQPGTMIIKEHNTENSDTKPQQTSLQKLNNLCNQFMPAFNLLLTCKKYYNDDNLKIKVKSLVMDRYIPQGLLIPLCPSYMRYKILQTQTYIQTKEAFETLGNLCIQATPITDDQIEKIVNSNGVSENIVYIPWISQTISCFASYTLIEYLYNEAVLKFLLNNLQDFDQCMKNIFLLIEYLCQTNKINLRLPITDNSISIEQYLVEIYKYENNLNYLTNVSLPFIQSLLQDETPKNIYERRREEPTVTGMVADLFLFSQYKIYLNQKDETKKLKDNVISRLTELSHIKTQKNIRKSVIKITSFLIFIISIMSYCYQNGYFKKIIKYI